MNLKFYIYSLYKLPLLLIVYCLFTNCSNEKPSEQNVIVVKVPPFYNKNLSQVENYWRFQHFLFPQGEIPNPISGGLPNDNSLLSVSVKENGELKLNSKNMGTVSETRLLTE